MTTQVTSQETLYIPIYIQDAHQFAAIVIQNGKALFYDPFFAQVERGNTCSDIVISMGRNFSNARAITKEQYKSLLPNGFIAHRGNYCPADMIDDAYATNPEAHGILIQTYKIEWSEAEKYFITVKDNVLKGICIWNYATQTCKIGFVKNNGMLWLSKEECTFTIKNIIDQAITSYLNPRKREEEKMRYHVYRIDAKAPIHNGVVLAEDSYEEAKKAADLFSQRLERGRDYVHCEIVDRVTLQLVYTTKKPKEETQ